MDFLNFGKTIKEFKKEGISQTVVYPDFKVRKSKDLMIRGGKFYSVWNEDKGLWSRDMYDVAELVDKELYEYAESLGGNVKVLTMSSYKTKTWKDFCSYINSLSDNYHELDEKLTFQNTKVKKEDYVSRRLSYSLEKGPHDAFDELLATLYSKEEQDKILWSIGSIVSGDSKKIQKFVVFYGPGGTGKSTVMNIILKLFDGYCTIFDAKELTSTSNTFATEAFASNPLVAVQQDGDLSRIEDNSKLNSIVSHEEILANEKFKSRYPIRCNCFLFMGTNKPVKITDSKSGLIRRLIDIMPTGNTIPPRKYYSLVNQVDFELGAIAEYCLRRYKEMGANYYANYEPRSMMMKTDVLYNFLEQYMYDFINEGGVSLKRVYDLYDDYCTTSAIKKIPMYVFREELKDYFEKFEPVARIDGKQKRSWFSGFRKDKFEAVQTGGEEDERASWIDLQPVGKEVKVG